MFDCWLHLASWLVTGSNRKQEFERPGECTRCRTMQGRRDAPDGKRQAQVLHLPECSHKNDRTTRSTHTLLQPGQGQIRSDKPHERMGTLVVLGVKGKEGGGCLSFPLFCVIVLLSYLASSFITSAVTCPYVLMHDESRARAGETALSVKKTTSKYNKEEEGKKGKERKGRKCVFSWCVI